MQHVCKSTAAAIVGLGALALIATPGFAASQQSDMKARAQSQLAHMGQGQGGQVGSQPCPMSMMARGVSGQGMMGFGTDSREKMGPDFGQGPALGSQVVPTKDLTAEDVRHFLQHRLEMHGNKRLKVGDVKETDEDKIAADITTVDDSLVQRLEVDRHTGRMRHAE